MPKRHMENIKRMEKPTGREVWGERCGSPLVDQVGQARIVLCRAALTIRKIRDFTFTKKIQSIC